MTLETVTIRIGGQEHQHKNFSGQCSAEQAVREASASLVWTRPGLPCEPGDDVKITFGSDLWLTGQVQDLRPSHDERSRAYAVTFTSKTIDGVECSIEHPEMGIDDCDLEDIAKAFDSQKIGIAFDAARFKKARHQVRPGETWFDTVSREAKIQGAMIADTPEGKFKIADKPEGRHAGVLKRGEHPYKSGSAQLSMDRRFSDVKVWGQAATGTKAASLRPQTAAKDPEVKRYRPLLRLFEGDVDSARMKRRVEREARRSAGQGTKASIVVTGWRDEAGKMWTPNFLIPVDSDWLGIDQLMVIRSVTFTQDGERGGSQATLELVDPRALGGENPRGKSAKGWSAPQALDAEYREL